MLLFIWWYKMRRIIYNNLLQWKNNSRRQPLIVLGANKIGKTHIIKEFCQKEYKDVVFFDLLRDTSIVDLFKRRLNAEEKYRMLKILIGLEIDIESPETIIFFDEIQESEELISNLKFLNEEYPHVNIICVGSLLGVKLRRFNLSFPVGKVEMINMYPMNFKEFLMAFNEDLLISELNILIKKIRL